MGRRALLPRAAPDPDSLLLLILTGSLEASVQLVNVDLVQALLLGDWGGWGKRHVSQRGTLGILGGLKNAAGLGQV